MNVGDRRKFYYYIDHENRDLINSNEINLSISYLFFLK